jgi:hypothetical protein
MPRSVYATALGQQSVGRLFRTLLLEKKPQIQNESAAQLEESKLAELAENIRQHAVLQPILVRPLDQSSGAMGSENFPEHALQVVDSVRNDAKRDQYALCVCRLDKRRPSVH